MLYEVENHCFCNTIQCVTKENLRQRGRGGQSKAFWLYLPLDLCCWQRICLPSSLSLIIMVTNRRYRCLFLFACMRLFDPLCFFSSFYVILSHFKSFKVILSQFPFSLLVFWSFSLMVLTTARDCKVLALFKTEAGKKAM